MKKVIKRIFLVAAFLGTIGLINAQVDTTNYNSEQRNQDYNREVQKSQEPPEKGLFLGIGIGIGATDFHYKNAGFISKPNERMLFKNGHKPKLGGQLGIDASYYFTRNWGISLGLGLSIYNSMGVYNGLKPGNYYTLGEQHDPDASTPDLEYYELRVRLLNWQELQKSYFFDIPLMIKYQTKWGKMKNGMYFGLGIKYQQPIIKSTYKVIDAKYDDINDSDNWRLNVSGYHSNNNIDLGWNSDIIPEHGFGVITNPNEKLNWNGTMALKGSWTGIAEIGFLIGLNRRIDLTIGTYFDYGFNNIKKKGTDKDLISVNGDNYSDNFKNQGSTGKINKNPVGYGLEYSGIINSNHIGKTNLMSWGVKFGLRVKIGKLKASYLKYEKEEIIEPTEEDSLDRLEDLLDVLEDLLKNQNKPNVAPKDNKPKKNIDVSTDDDDDDDDDIGELYKSPKKLSTRDIAILECCVYFDLEKYDIRNSELWCLEQKLILMKAYPKIRIRILGNTCDRADDQINIPLGQNRAEEVKKWLVQRGIAASRIETVSYSKYFPQIQNDSEEHRKQNRRADFEVISY